MAAAAAYADVMICDCDCVCFCGVRDLRTYGEGRSRRPAGSPSVPCPALPRPALAGALTTDWLPRWEPGPHSLERVDS
ncbi:hypothetical protein ABT224_32990 [Streptomyces sp. NPDC001584]|uniref:hypothetical protein n=1 Tax=Streptomyces sp. NPDC001584 TaxID=3154521 RepID=UPI003329613F